MLALQCGVGRAATDTYPWENRLRGDTIVLLGEVHDNAIQHRLRLEVMQRAFAAGWRPAVAMEQFDRERQADIDLARKEKPHDADYLIAKATIENGKSTSGWNWEYYRPYVVLALQYDVPLLAANVSRTDAEKIVAHGYASTFDETSISALGLDRAAESVTAAQSREIDEGHCHALPKEMLPAMVRAQMARDAVMAATLRTNAANGVVLLAGNGHVRRDIGVPVWLDRAISPRLLVVGFLERDSQMPVATAFDAVVTTETASRPDPCASFRNRTRTQEQ